MEIPVSLFRVEEMANVMKASSNFPTSTNSLAPIYPTKMHGVTQQDSQLHYAMAGAISGLHSTRLTTD